MSAISLRLRAVRLTTGQLNANINSSFTHTVHVPLCLIAGDIVNYDASGIPGTLWCYHKNTSQDSPLVIPFLMNEVTILW